MGLGQVFAVATRSVLVKQRCKPSYPRIILTLLSALIKPQPQELKLQNPVRFVQCFQLPKIMAAGHKLPVVV